MQERPKICAVTGHRKIPTESQRKIRKKIMEELELAISDGYKVFISGFADGVDLMFAECVLELKKKHSDLFLEAAIPYLNRTQTKDKHFQSLFEQCNSFKIICNEYKKDCFMIRNRYMVQQAERLIAVYDGRESGGTLFTMRYADTMERDIRIIECSAVK